MQVIHDTNNMRRHIGKIKTSDHRCIVVFMRLPDDPNTSLVIDVDTLPLKYNQVIHEVLESVEGQTCQDFGTILSRRKYYDTGRDILTEMHLNGRLMPVPVDNIIMFPTPNQGYPLREVLKNIDYTQGKTTDFPEPMKAIPSSNIDLSNKTSDELLDIAKGLLKEAELLQHDVNKKIKQAYEIAPQLKPVTNESVVLETKPKTRKTTVKV